MCLGGVRQAQKRRSQDNTVCCSFRSKSNKEIGNKIRLHEFNEATCCVAFPILIRYF